jgi:hypothetical protein
VRNPRLETLEFQYGEPLLPEEVVVPALLKSSRSIAQPKSGGGVHHEYIRPAGGRQELATRTAATPDIRGIATGMGCVFP